MLFNTNFAVGKFAAVSRKTAISYPYSPTFLTHARRCWVRLHFIRI